MVVISTSFVNLPTSLPLVKELKVGEEQVDKTGTTRSNENASTGYYVVSYDSNNITNTLVKDVTATKKWVDGSDNNRPTVEVELLQNGKSFTPAKTGTISNDFVNYTWTGVRVNDGNGKPYVYFDLVVPVLST